jgi:hypothetical protein
MTNRAAILVVGFGLLGAVEPAVAAAATDVFSRVIRPAFERECLGCHGESQTLSKLDLRTREAMLAGGQRGPALVPGNAAGSLLYKSVAGLAEPHMPPGGESKRLPADVIQALRDWIDAGAPWSETVAAAAWGSYNEEDLWAFRPLRDKFGHNTIDGFIDAALASQGIEGAPPADRRTLIRRVTIDLTGLPPTPEEVQAFVNDSSPAAWPQLVDRLLASPRYGERWGRHWLDVVRYADTSGYSNDFERPNAWRYRDYVIRSFNSNKPYDRFVQEQIAGDELFPGDPEALIATGFLRSGPWEHTGMSVEAVTRQMFLDDVTHNTAAVFLGVTLGCARCHDHKFDPIPTRDYYRMQAIFATTEFARPQLDFLPAERTGDLDQGRARLREIVRRTEQRMAALKRRENLDPAEREEVKLYQKHLQLYRESLDRYEAKAFAVSSGPRDGETDGGPNLKYPARAAYEAPVVHILRNGDVQSPAEPVTPGVLSLVERYAALPAPAVPETVAGRRAALARWITDSRHPLTARVMVNRIWQYHFGRGLAADANNFGKTGARPTHPELLDWLARRFIASGWDVKAMHRLILLSRTYQRGSSHPDIGQVRRRDPENKLLAFFPPRRVEAEVLRDSILAVAGELSPEAGGPGVFPKINEDVARQPRHAMGSLQPAYYPSARKSERNRRTVYTFQQRSLVDPMIEVFNGPSLDQSCERREISTVPTQAFTLFNSQFTHDMALAFAARLEREAKSPRDRIERAFQLAFGRPPDNREAGLALAHLAKMTAHHRSVPPPPKAEVKPVVHMITSELTGEQHRFVQQPDVVEYEEDLHPSEVSPETRALADLCLVLLNSNEFVYIY